MTNINFLLENEKYIDEYIKRYALYESDSEIKIPINPIEKDF
jgi:hypothetical protein